jgi:hypothetical protein
LRRVTTTSHGSRPQLARQGEDELRRRLVHEVRVLDLDERPARSWRRRNRSTTSWSLAVRKSGASSSTSGVHDVAAPAAVARADPRDELGVVRRNRPVQRLDHRLVEVVQFQPE